MDITTNQAVQNLAAISDANQIPMVNENTERRIGISLAEHEAGKGTVVTSLEELTRFLDSLQEDHGLQTRIPA